MVDILNRLIKGYTENENYIIENYTITERIDILNKLTTFNEYDKLENKDVLEDEKFSGKFFSPEESLNLLMEKEVIDSSDIIVGAMLVSLDDYGIKQVLDSKKLSQFSAMKLIDIIKNDKLKIEYVKKYSSYYDENKLRYIIIDLESDDDKIDLIEYFNDNSMFKLFSYVEDVRKRVNAFYKCQFYDRVAKDLENIDDDDFIIEWLNKIYKYIGSDVIQKLIIGIEDENKKINILLKMKKEIRFFQLYCKSILNTITSEENILKFFIENPEVEIIEDLKNSDFKKTIIEKLGDKLYTHDIISIVKSIDDDDYKIKFIQENIELDSYAICGIISTLKDDDKKIDLTNQYKDKISISLISIILCSIKDDNKKIESMHNFKDLQMNNRENIISSIKNPELKLSIIISEGFSRQNFGWLKEQIAHNDSIINCKTVNYALLNWYSNENEINLENLCMFVERYGYMVLRFLDNKNILNILNSDKETFNKFLNLFSDDCLKLDYSTVDSIYDTIIQRIFRNNNVDGVFDLFNTIKELVYINDKENLLIRIKYLKLNGLIPLDISSEQFVLNLLNKETREEYLNKLKEITDKYIIQKRNDYFENRKKTIHHDVNIGIKLAKNKFISGFLCSDIEEIIEALNSVEEFLDINGKKLLSNKPLLIECIKFKKDPSNYNFNNDVKKHLKTFNDILDIVEQKLNFNKKLNEWDFLSDSYILKPNDINLEYLLKIMCEIDINQLDLYLFSNEELYQKLLKILKKSKIIGWGDTFEKVLEEAGISYDSSLVAYLISHFYKYYPLLEKKLDSGEIKNISILSLIDEASIYSSSSNIYKILLDEEDYNLICKNPYPNAAPVNKNDRLKAIPKYIISMYEKKYITVPTINENVQIGNKKSLNVVVGNFTDTINLTYGERTDSCMRIGGQGSSLFEFCLLNENGFHVRITDPDTGQFVSRVSGFRNGNTVVLNQLRNSKLQEKYSNDDLVLVVKRISQILIEKTKNSKYPIENVIISEDYAMENKGTTITLEKKLQEGLGYFYTDVRTNNAIVLASINSDNSLAPIKTGPKNVERYEVLRSKIKCITGEKEISKEINRLLLIKHLLIGKNESYFAVRPIDTNYYKLYYGEDWYIALDNNNEILEEFHIDRGDQRVYDEINEAKQIILNNQSNNSEGGLVL